MKQFRSIAASLVLSSAAALAFIGCASREAEYSTPAQSASAGTYPLKTCVVSGEDLGKTPYVFTHNGQTVQLCCKDCLAKFNQEPDKYMAKLNQPK